MELAAARVMARRLMDWHMGPYADFWAFDFDRALQRAGCCKYGIRTITLSANLVPKMTEREVRNTVLHEIAHALTPGHHHDSVWRRKFVEIGGDGRRTHNLTIEKKWLGVCPNGHRIERNRRRKISCSRCSKVFNPDYMFTWTEMEEG